MKVIDDILEKIIENRLEKILEKYKNPSSEDAKKGEGAHKTDSKADQKDNKVDKKSVDDSNAGNSDAGSDGSKSTSGDSKSNQGTSGPVKKNNARSDRNIKTSSGITRKDIEDLEFSRATMHYINKNWDEIKKGVK